MKSGEWRVESEKREVKREKRRERREE